MTTRYPQSFPADEASSWRRVRRYAVPRSMIERATERRLAGDWQGACAAGLDLEARDHHERTPIHVAVDEGPVAVVRALLDAGARTDVADDQDRSLPFLIDYHKRKELLFLKKAIIRDQYPDPARAAEALLWEWGGTDD